MPKKKRKATPKPLPPFGAGSLSYEHGYTLDIIHSHLEGLVYEEEENAKAASALKRLNKAYDALQLLYEIVEGTDD